MTKEETKEVLQYILRRVQPAFLAPAVLPLLPLWGSLPHNHALTLVSCKKFKTASVARSTYRCLTEGALGCLHPYAFSISFHNRVAWGAHE